MFTFFSLAAPSLLRRSPRSDEAGSSFAESGAVCRYFGGGDSDDVGDVLVESVKGRITATDGSPTRLCFRARRG